MRRVTGRLGTASGFTADQSHNMFDPIEAGLSCSHQRRDTVPPKNLVSTTYGAGAEAGGAGDAGDECEADQQTSRSGKDDA